MQEYFSVSKIKKIAMFYFKLIKNIFFELLLFIMHLFWDSMLVSHGVDFKISYHLFDSLTILISWFKLYVSLFASFPTLLIFLIRICISICYLTLLIGFCEIYNIFSVLLLLIEGWQKFRKNVLGVVLYLVV